MSPDRAADEPGAGGPTGADEPATAEGPAPAEKATAAEEPTAVVETSAGGVPDLAELERIAVPAVVRRTPRYRAFIATGVVVGLLITLGLGLATFRPDEPGGLTAVLLVGLGLVTVGGVLGGLVAVLLEPRR